MSSAIVSALGPTNDLHDLAELDDPVRSCGLQGGLVHEGTVLQLAAQPRNAGLDLHDVVESSEGVDDALCLETWVPPGSARACAGLVW